MSALRSRTCAGSQAYLLVDVPLTPEEEADLRGPRGYGVTLRECFIWETVDRERAKNVDVAKFEARLVAHVVEAANLAERYALEAKRAEAFATSTGDPGAYAAMMVQRARATSYFNALVAADRLLAWWCARC